MRVYIIKSRTRLAHTKSNVVYTTLEKAEKARGNDGGYYVISMEVV